MYIVERMANPIELSDDQKPIELFVYVARNVFDVAELQQTKKSRNKLTKRENKKTLLEKDYIRSHYHASLYGQQPGY